MRRGSLLISFSADFYAAGPDGFSFSREREQMAFITNKVPQRTTSVGREVILKQWRN